MLLKLASLLRQREIMRYEIAFDDDASLNEDTSKKQYLKARHKAKKTVKKMHRR